MVRYTVLRCPYCKYVWARRGECMPVSCPRCKKRFDYHSNLVKLEQIEVEMVSYFEMRDWLIDANRYSSQCDSLEEVEERTGQS